MREANVLNPSLIPAVMSVREAAVRKVLEKGSATQGG